MVPNQFVTVVKGLMGYSERVKTSWSLLQDQGLLLPALSFIAHGSQHIKTWAIIKICIMSEAFGTLRMMHSAESDCQH